MYPKMESERRRHTLPEEEEETFYSKRLREQLVEEEGLNNAEDWFMEGYEQSLPEGIEEDDMPWMDESSSKEVI